MQCPSCGGKIAWKDGIRYVREGQVQRYSCRSCGYRFSEPQIKVNVASQVRELLHSDSQPSEDNIVRVNSSLKKAADGLSFPGRKNVCSHVGSAPQRAGVAQDLIALPSYNSSCGVCASEQEAKNLVRKSGGNEKALANYDAANTSASHSATKSTPAETKAKIVEYSFWLLKQGYAESTIIGRGKLLRILAKRGANLFDTESVKEVIAKQNWSAGRKVNAVDAYTSFLQMHDMTWEPPKYRRIRKLPFIPTENEVDQLIAGCGKKTATLLQLLKETGMRIGEAWKLQWTDIDFVNNAIRVTPEKGSNPRILKASNKLMAMLSALQGKSKSNRIFGKSLKTHSRLFSKQRRRIASKLQNFRILRISFHTFRHFKATMEYHKTKDILHVMQVLGHKNIRNTLIYTQLVDLKDDDYVSKVAKTVKEACQLVEAGFEYVCEIDGARIFRKRK